MTKLMSVPSICLVLSCLFFSFFFFSPNMILYFLMSVPFICHVLSFQLVWYYFLYPTLFLHPLSTYPSIHPYINLPSSSPLCLCIYLSHDLSLSLYQFISISHPSIEIYFSLSFYHFYSFVFLSNRESSGSTWFWGSDGWRTVRENFDFFNNRLQNFLL